MLCRTSRVGLPSGPNSRKSSILDLTQQQQQIQQLQLQQQQQHLQQHLPIGIGNNDTSPPSDEEDKRFRPRWKGSGSQLPPQSPKQALSRLKQAASVSNVAQERHNQLLGSNLGDGSLQLQQQANLRKGSMINLRGQGMAQGQGQSQDMLSAGQLHQRKSSMFQLGEVHTQAHAQPQVQSLQRKASVYVGKGSDTPTMGTPTRKGSIYQRTSTDSGSDSPQRKHSVVKTLSGSYVNVSAISGSESSYGLKLGPSQIHPKGYRLTTARYGELKMGFVKIKGNVEVELICARNIVNEDCETPPDTYVKCYIKDGERLRHKKKTRVVRHSAEPFYRQTIKYQVSKWGIVTGANDVIVDVLVYAVVDTEDDADDDADGHDSPARQDAITFCLHCNAINGGWARSGQVPCSSDVFGRNIVIMVWQRCVGFEHNQGMGGTEVNLDKVNIGQHINGWYPLFPMHSYGGSDSDNSP
ncbi:GL18439 [Drosophila persimilis]|uniref:GL18439 n=1 Tax=Drosophila persimilis TaxID=7234 RepID=B4HA79_DROPE|nr:GL18439 [Drosophila persimilis]